MTSRRHVIVSVVMLLFTCLGPVSAQQGRIIEKRETEASGVPRYIEEVAAPGAIWCTVSECTNLLIVGHQPGMDRHLTVFKLDRSGHVVTTPPPEKVTLPLDPALEEYDNFAVAGVCHPDFPLLYVLQDLSNMEFAWQAGHQMPGLTGPIANSVFEHLDRLLVYSFRDGNIQKLQSVRADWIKFGSYDRGNLAQLVTFGLDADRGRLHMPLLINRDERKQNLSAHGYLALDGRGLLTSKEGEIVPEETMNLYGVGGLSGVGCVFLPLDRVAWGGGWGEVLIWHRPDGQAQTLYLGQSHPTVISGHPAIPIVYAIFAKTKLFFVEFVEGHPTLQPRYIELGGLLSPPVTMAKRNQLAVGGHDNVALFNLDADGEMTGEFTRVRLKGREFQALYYSQHFDRLYVAGKLAP